MDKWIYKDIVLALFEKGSWKLIKGLRLIVNGTNKGTLYCLHGKALMGKFIALAEIHSHKELWHKKLGHMSQKGLDKLYNMDKFDAKGSKLIFVMNANMETK